MNRRDVLTLSGAAAAVALAGCAGEDPTDGDGQTTDGGNGSTPGEPEPANGRPDVDDERLAELVAGNAAFALDLHRQVADADGGNQFLSPYSISVALAMTYAGARGETEEQMRATLRYTLGEDVHPAFADLQSRLDERGTSDSEGGDPFQLSVANALWGREGVQFSDDYRSLLDEYYGAGLRRADFAGDPEGERERINEWVAEETEDRIEDLLPRNALGPSTVLVLTNAVFFLAGWRHEFDPEDTEDAAFTALDGSESAVPMMHQNLRTNYADLAGAEAIELPYVGRDISMVLILPEEGRFGEFERTLDVDRLFGIFEELGDARGDIALPRFEYDTEVQLSEALSELGMPDAFGPGADFGGMFESGASEAFIDDVYHEAFVSVDEEGTEAAAATAVAVVESMPGTSFDLTFDRPFLFCIRDKPTDAVLFLGRVVDAGDAQ